MKLRFVMVCALASLVAVGSFPACNGSSSDSSDDDDDDDDDDDEDDDADDGEGAGGPGTTSSSSSTVTTVNSTSSGPVACELPGEPAPTTCDVACIILYECGALACPSGQPCPGFGGTTAEQSAFVAQCVPGCEAQPALISLIDPSDCAGTVSTVASLNASFSSACQNGF